VTTRTGDADGDVVDVRPVQVDDAALDAALLSHTGEIDQVPPMHSALKREGRPLYELARAGIEVERVARARSS
jgi:tRNA pseudouridine55 synthase